MKKDAIYAGKTRLKHVRAGARGRIVELEGEQFYEIDGIQSMEPFFMSVVSNSDHWMFISSNGALTAGRKNPEIALFPYCTVDKIHDSSEITGAKTIVWVEIGGKWYLWEPFSDRYAGIYRIQSNLYKNIVGNRIIFEEINNDLRLTFAYQWCSSDKFGFVRKSILSSQSPKPVRVDLLDGIQNILPQGVDRMMQTDKSCLVDAYKKCELVPETGLGIYRLSSIPVDRAEPSESLKASTVWSCGDGICRRLLSSVQVGTFRKGEPLADEHDVVGKRGAYFVNIEIDLQSGQRHQWYLVAEVNQTAAGVAALNRRLLSTPDLRDELEADNAAGTLALMKIVASADGLQCTEDRLSVSRHFSNVLFNVMRGGIFDEGYTVAKSDLLQFAAKANTAVFRENREWFNNLPASIHYSDLIQRAWASENGLLIRMCLEYMPLTFGRRHGDPSRPWNVFAIETKNEDGSKLLNYQGNWRDIFQNWEGLAISFPAYLESMAAKFLNASTADGYNPYRITREGFEWEVHNPKDPWSFIGYWGDHQTVYLLKLLELSHRYHPGRLQQFLAKDLFSYANVPYRIRDYSSVLHDPHHSIDYDEEMEKLIARRVAERGADGKVMWNAGGEIYLVNLTEKLLVSILSKLSNFVPDGGIWMNTQRPEWNDANNALAGHGLSMVTLCYLRRYIEFCRKIFTETSLAEVPVSVEVAAQLRAIFSALERHRVGRASGLNDRTRRLFLDELGEAGTAYRKAIYARGFSGARSPIAVRELLDFFSTATDYLDATIRSNRRPDGLYHSYNLLSVKETGEIAVSHLHEMLEGQVAVLGSGLLQGSESIEVLEALRGSSMFREDQYSYLLYPARTLPRFLEKNNIPGEFAEKSELFKRLAVDGDRSLVEKDVDGVFHFNGAFTNRNVLAAALHDLSERGYGDMVSREMKSILDVYEAMFHHKAFTGRSGTFYSYEGLGSIYWHMVSKLLLAVEEVLSDAVRQAGSGDVVARLREIYFDIRKGLGTGKSPAEYGAFPTDPYSHTPSHSGAQQPGMTGQVKEDIITRFRELALVVEHGKISFEPSLIPKGEFLRRPAVFRYFDVHNQDKCLNLGRNQMGYTFCQVPVILEKSRRNSVCLHAGEGIRRIEGLEIDPDASRSIFERMGRIHRIEVQLALR
jgi:hypothetical protein